MEYYVDANAKGEQIGTRSIRFDGLMMLQKWLAPEMWFMYCRESIGRK